MGPTVLISGTFAAPTTARFSLGDGAHPCTLYAKGLAGAETVTLRILDSTETAVEWKKDGADRALDVDNNVLAVYGPGEFELRIASSVGAVEVGLYGAG